MRQVLNGLGLALVSSVLAGQLALANSIELNVTNSESVQTALAPNSSSSYGTSKSSGPNWAMCRAWVTCNDGQELSCGVRGVFMASCYALDSKSVSCSSDEGENQQYLRCK